MRHRGDRLIERILASGGDAAVQALINAFWRGYPIEQLRRLLRSDDERVLKDAAWIASELGEKIRPLVGEVAPLLEHPARDVRFYILDAVLVGATVDDGEAIARAVSLIEDPDKAVRWKAMYFLGRATTEQIAAAVPYIGDAHTRDLLTWLLRLGNTSEDKQDVVRRLGDDDPVTRWYAAAGALRLGGDDRAPLERAAASTDPEIAKIATEGIADLGLKDRRLTRRHERRRRSSGDGGPGNDSIGSGSECNQLMKPADRAYE